MLCIGDYYYSQVLQKYILQSFKTPQLNVHITFKFKRRLTSRATETQTKYQINWGILNTTLVHSML